MWKQDKRCEQYNNRLGSTVVWLLSFLKQKKQSCIASINYYYDISRFILENVVYFQGGLGDDLIYLEYDSHLIAHSIRLHDPSGVCSFLLHLALRNNLILPLVILLICLWRFSNDSLSSWYWQSRQNLKDFSTELFRLCLLRLVAQIDERLCVWLSREREREKWSGRWCNISIRSKVRPPPPWNNPMECLL